jgi:hypothetical protein
MAEIKSTPERPLRPDYLRSQLLWLHVAIVIIFTFVVYSKTLLGNWLNPSVHLLFIACATMICGVKGSTLFYCVYEGEDEDEESNNNVSNEDLGPVLTAADAARMPIMGSCVLFGLFCVYKYLGQDIIKLMFTLYVVLMCTLGLGANIADFVAMLRNKATKPLFTVPYVDVKVTVVEIVSYIGSGYMGYYYVQTKDDYEANWIVNNVFGVSFCLLGMKQVNISTYRAACIMLSGLFVYDVFWVFLSKPLIGSNVMVTVAKGVKAPIKLMFPREGKGMIFNETNSGMVPSQRVALDLATASAGVVGNYNSSELLGCKLTCIHSDACVGMEWDTEADSPACLLFSEAAGALVAAASSGAVHWFTKGNKFMPSMLGLGDIVVPGIFLSLLAKFDVVLEEQRKVATYFNYFNVAMVAYFLSLVCTLAAMLIWEAAQPALLYIVPFLIITSGIMAWAKGDLNQLLEFEVAGAENEYSVQSMIDILTDESGKPKESLSSDDIEYLKQALAFEQTKLAELKKDK